MVVYEAIFSAFIARQGTSEKQAFEKAKQYSSVCRDIPVEVIKQTLQEYGLISPPERFREIALKKAMVRALKELLYAIEKLPAGDGFIRFADPRLPEFVELMGGMAELRKLSLEEIRRNLLRLYPELSPAGGIVYDAVSGREKLYLLDLREKKLMTVRIEEIKALEGKEYRALGGRDV